MSVREASILRAVLTSALLVLSFAPTVAADETHADCEETQPWIGYRTTDPARVVVAPLLGQHGVLFEACEGEQWDGQDAIAGGETLDVGLGPDPNAAPSGDPLNPAGARVTLRDASELYVASSVGFVARGAVYVGTCGAGEQGLEGEASCGGTRELRTGVYARDNTPGNALQWLFNPGCLISLTGCYAAENDCSQATYQAGAYDPPSRCGRDNSAIGAQLILP